MFTKHTIVVETEKHLFRSEIEACIKNYINKNDLKYNGQIEKASYLFCSRYFFNRPGLEYSIIFWAREKTKDELFAEQIEFQIKQMST